jgi:putative acyl-CoA dehydrogenase
MATDSCGYATHEVLNQPPALADYDVYGSDPILQRVVKTYDAESAGERLHEAGRVVGSVHVQELARRANRQLPELRTHDRFGNRVDRIDFHPAWHDCRMNYRTFANTRDRPDGSLSGLPC